MTVIPVNEPVLCERELEYVTECVRTRVGFVGGQVHRRVRTELGRLLRQEIRRRGQQRHGGAPDRGRLPGSRTRRRSDHADVHDHRRARWPSSTTAASPVLVDSDPATWCMDVGGDREKDHAPYARDHGRAHLRPPGRHGPACSTSPRSTGCRSSRMRPKCTVRSTCPTGRRSPTWRRCGSFGDVSCFSFYANKLITTGEGGMLVTDDAAIADAGALAAEPVLSSRSAGSSMKRPDSTSASPTSRPRWGWPR